MSGCTEDANPEDGLSQLALACDCEREEGLCLIEGDDLGELIRPSISVRSST